MPRPPTDGSAAEPSPILAHGGGRLPIPPDIDLDTAASMDPLARRGAGVSRPRGLGEEIQRLKEQTGRSPDVYWLDVSKEYCLVVNTPIRNASQDANIYLVCGNDFPDTPPVAVVSVAAGFDAYGQAKEQEMELNLSTIQNWDSGRTLLQVYLEIITKLDDGDHRVSPTSSPIFDRYGQINGQRVS